AGGPEADPGRPGHVGNGWHGGGGSGKRPAQAPYASRTGYMQPAALERRAFPALHSRSLIPAAVLGGAAVRIKCESISLRKRYALRPQETARSGIDGEAQPAT